MLALYTGKGVTPEVNLRECILGMPPQSLNKAEPTMALKPRGEVQNRGISGPTNGHVSNKNFKKNPHEIEQKSVSRFASDDTSDFKIS